MKLEMMWRKRGIVVRAGLIACVVGAVALLATYRVADAQIRLIDIESAGDEADPLIKEMIDFFATANCIAEWNLREFEARIATMLKELKNDEDLIRKQILPTRAGSTGFTLRQLRFADDHVSGKKGNLYYWRSQLRELPVCRFMVFSPPEPYRQEIGSSQRTWTGGYFGTQLLENSGRVKQTERDRTTGAITFESTDSVDPLGVGIVAGYNFRPWNNNVVVGQFASFDFLKQTINHNFAGGQFLGTTTHWIITAGAKGGFVVTPGLYLYGLAGASWLNQSLNVNFATAATSNVTTPGFTLGLGGEYQPSSWRLFGNPVSVFLQYQHTWWNTANFNTPASSPAFNYAFKRDDDTIKLGFNIYLSPPAAPPPTRGLITK